ncbi:MAG: prolyl oligopeptidase family serine peptidase [Roseimicrobium sp.]
MRTAVVLALTLVAALHAAPPAGNGRVARTWTSSDGKTMQAELLEFNDKEVKVKRSTDFQIVKIPLDRLGEADRKMIVAMVRERHRDNGMAQGAYATLVTGQFAQSKSKQGLNFQLLGNPKWDGKQRYPLVIWLHGAGQSGDDNTSQMGGATTAFSKPENQAERPCFILAPQCPSREIGWKNEVAQNLMALIADLVEELPIDEARLYLTGSSMGGSGTWSTIARWPDVFACAVPLCGGGDPKMAEPMKGVPIWVFHGDKDDMVPVDRSRTMNAALKAVGGNIQYSELAGEGHSISGVVYGKPELHTWMFQQRKGSASTASAAPAK